MGIKKIMTESQEQTLKDLLLVIPVMVNDKFRRGDKEHKGNIQDMTVEQLVNEISDELVDAMIYALLALKKLREVKGFVNDRRKLEIPRPIGQPHSDLSKT